MTDLSVGYTAGLIALGVFITQLWLPTAISFLLAGVLRDEETAASWTVAAKILQSSHWTTLLRTDSVRPHAVRTPIFLASLAIPVATLLTAVASVVTPLGLYDDLAIGDREIGNFSYVRDTSAYFDGTSPRRNYTFSRQCTFHNSHIGLGNPAPCPFTGDTLIYSEDGKDWTWSYPDNLTMEIPPIVREIYSSGTRGIGTTVSNFFDIEWRQLTMRDDDDEIVNRGSPYAVSMFRQLDSVALDDVVKLVEGLIVDTRSGGVGFRNHTVPQPPDRNVTWQEDILFIEPVTACVNTNLTFDYTEHETWNTSETGPVDYRLTDRGGFVNLNHTRPHYDRDDPQANPDLWGRAYEAAMLNNFFTMLYLNVTNPADPSTGAKSFQYVNSTMGKSFPLWVDSLHNYRAASISGEYGSYLFATPGLGGNLRYPNPFNITQKGWFDELRLLCSGAGPSDTANVTNIFVTCGLVTGAPRRVDGGPQGIFESGSTWSTPIYSCATSVRATIKTVDFSTAPLTDPARQSAETARGLTSLRVTNITAKTYPSPDSYPLWAVEDSGYRLDDINPIWGLISPAYPAAHFPNISVVKQPSLYLVGLGSGSEFNGPHLSTLDNGMGYQNLPGSEFPIAVANSLYADSYGVTDKDWPFDLIGRADMAVFTRWQTLAATAEGAGRMIDLLWTDLAASAVVGTKGVATAPATQDAPQPVIHVRPVVHRIRYRFVYGIPAFALLMVVVLLSAGTFGVWLSGRSSLEKLRTRLQQLSAGRIFTIVLYPGESDFRMSPKQWSLVSGGKTVKFADGIGAVVEEDAQTPGGGVADVGADSKVHLTEEMGPVHHDPYEGGQHGGYIALGPVSYGNK